ncbi:O-antigen ligase family protein [Rhizobium sp. Leaf341]|uniref:O-antigen ligase family protein n=1 Tax=Rhizobium sp. Leaf341 TaxID=1736344 RepID=UPI00071282A9|nr:O-antigen ligase family protein [Rhizobium sp. Leaf341]KQR70812.1 hypothetical protein ASG03_04305 [Rhizobium sp. Leaf341]
MLNRARRRPPAGKDGAPSSPRENGLMRISRRAITLGFWCVLLMSVLSYGANAALSLSLTATMACTVLLLAFLTQGEPSTARKPFWFALGLLAALTLWSWMQTWSWPPSLVEEKLWQPVQGLAPEAQRSGSVSAGDILLGLLKAALPIFVFMTSLILFDREDKAVRAFKAVAVIGGAVAVIGVLQFVATPDFVLLQPKLFYRDSLTGPFVNRNTAGTFFGVVSIMLLALAVHAATKIDRYRLLSLLNVGGRLEQPREVAAAVTFGGLFLVTLAAEFLTNSRAAIVITFIALVGLILFLTFGPRYRPPARRRRTGWRKAGRRIAIAIALVWIPLLVFSVLSSRVQQRFEETGVVDPRFCALHAIWSATTDHWPKGAGLTSFQDIYPPYREPACGVVGIWDKAHNVYLEGLLALGIFFPVALVATAGVLGRIFWKGFAARKNRSYLVAAGFCATVLVAAHAAVDFSLQIPGFATFFAAVLGPVTTICLRKGRLPHGAPDEARMQGRAPIGALEHGGSGAG